MEAISDTRAISIELAQNSVARARHPVDRKPQGWRQEEDEEEGRSRKKPDANKSTAEGVRAREVGQRERKSELRRVSDCNMAPKLPPAVVTRAK